MTSPVRWAGSASSSAIDSARAGHEATMAAIDGRPDAKLVVVFSSERHDLDRLIASVNRTAGDVPLIGCSTAGEIATSGPADAGVVVFALGGPGFQVQTNASMRVRSRLRDAGVELAQAMDIDPPDAHRVLLMLTDALAGDQQEILRGVYSVIGASVPLVGGCAGDDLQMTATYQFHNTAVLTDAVVVAHISSDAPMGIGVRHGWVPVGDPMFVTRSQGNIVYELDGKPALDVYLERLDAPDIAASDGAAFTRFALNHPLGLTHRGSEPHARFIGEADYAQRALGCIAAVTEGSSVWVMEGDHESVLKATTEACNDAIRGLDGNEPIGALAFDCIARRSVLGDQGIVDEIAHLAGCLHGAPVAGFYTYGEIARTRGVGGFHNETLVVLALA